jgi:hypothetical protein
MADIDPEQFSILTNALTVALNLARLRAERAAGNHREAADLFEAVERAAQAAHALRPTNGDERRDR